MSSEKRRKLLLINPTNQSRKGFVYVDSMRFMPINLGIIAALTPPDWDIELFDESFEPFRFIEADLVGFTAFTSNAYRAYQIAEIYKEKGIATVMGGVHATMCTEEALQYVNTVVQRDAESVWPTVIRDFEAGNMKRIYDGGNVNPEEIPHVRRDIFKYPYTYDLVQTARGCPMGCDFCSVTQMCGKKYREREVEDVLDEMEETLSPLLFIVDDNLVNNNKQAQERAIRLFKGMIKRGIKKHWLTQASINIADNEEVLYWANKAGCKLILIGVEAETPKALKDMNKRLNLKRGIDSYEIAFSKIHKHGIGILGTMIFGLESDTKEDLYARRDFILKSSIDSYQTTILTPLPGTVMFDRLTERGLIESNNYPEDWEKYQFMHSVVNTPALNTNEMNEVMKDIWLSLYNKETIRKKMMATIRNTKSLSATYWSYATNHNYGRMMLEKSIENEDNGVDYNMEWKNRKRSLYLKVTDRILVLIYFFKWEKLIKNYFASAKHANSRGV
jgi:radical SAM superfamily enzyme YgiQ (UPF0313 family)